MGYLFCMYANDYDSSPEESRLTADELKVLKGVLSEEEIKRLSL